jgi:hypothetical protein
LRGEDIDGTYDDGPDSGRNTFHHCAGPSGAAAPHTRQIKGPGRSAALPAGRRQKHCRKTGRSKEFGRKPPLGNGAGTEKQTKTNRVQGGKEKSMETTIIRVVAGVLFVLILGVVIQRRRTRVK